jgi:NCS1 family nucleobase:cation symporter-1
MLLDPGIVVSLTGRIAATYHIPFPVIARASLCVNCHITLPSSSNLHSGMWGCMPMIFLRSTVALLWTAISVVQVCTLLRIIASLVLTLTSRFKAGGFLENMISAIWPKFPTWNHLPASANITSASMLCVVIYWFIQTYVSMLPIKFVLSASFEQMGC